jgi:hypothetical protein
MGTGIEMQQKALTIVAAKGTTKIIEYEVSDTDGPGSIPNWFIGVILLLRDEIEEDEKIVVHNGVIKIVKKTPVDRFLDWIKDLKRGSGGELNSYGSSMPPVREEGAIPRAS